MTASKHVYDDLDKVLHALRQGGFILLHDSLSRENEVDLVVAAEMVTPEHVRVMRREAGGLLCLALANQVGDKLGIANMSAIFACAASKYPVLRSLEEKKAPYGDKPAFSISVNHRRTFTGVTDRDRAMTISELARLSKRALNDGIDCRQIFATEFKAPGHVHLLIESRDSLAERRGHTELSVHLCRLARMAPAAAICEMLDGRTYNALSIEDAKAYAHNNSIPLLDGQQVIASFLQPRSS